ncbi:hypothetical protein BG32_12900 [Mesotoga sp. HF07.pep.5.2.highcov]|nr:hypothetical protein BG32_12900 [Mesotoga sp. HF07.pep.5.2.highcov]
MKSSSRLFKIAEPYLPSMLFPSLYSLNNGLTKNGYLERTRFRHSDKATGRNLDTIASRLSSTNGEPFNDQPVPLLFPTTNLLPPTLVLQLTSWNLQLFFSANGEPLNDQPVSLLFRTRNLQPRTSLKFKPRS